MRSASDETCLPMCCDIACVRDELNLLAEAVRRLAVEVRALRDGVQ